MDLKDFQTKLLFLLSQKGLSKEDMYSVMLVLTKEEKAKKMIAFLEETGASSPDDICEMAGKIAFGENA